MAMSGATDLTNPLKHVFHFTSFFHWLLIICPIPGSRKDMRSAIRRFSEAVKPGEVSLVGASAVSRAGHTKKEKEKRSIDV